MQNRSKELQRASWIGIAGNALLAFIKILIGFLSGSFAVIGDGIDTATDVFTYVITLITARIISKPPDPKYPYGYKKAETSATKILAFIIFFAGAELFLSTLRQLISGEIRELPGMVAVYVTVISIISKIILSVWQYKIGKQINSPMIIANARNMRNDVLISSSVLIGLIFTFVFKMPVFDSITAMAVSLWIIKVAFEIYKESNLEMMDGLKDTTIYDKVFQSVDEVEGAHNPHRVRIRKISELYLIALDIEVNEDIKVIDAHLIAKQVEDRIKMNIDNIFDILVHIEPLGNIEGDEPVGISKESLSKKKANKPSL